MAKKFTILTIFSITLVTFCDENKLKPTHLRSIIPQLKSNNTLRKALIAAVNKDATLAKLYLTKKNDEQVITSLYNLLGCSNLALASSSLGDFVTETIVPTYFCPHRPCSDPERTSQSQCIQ